MKDITYYKLPIKSKYLGLIEHATKRNPQLAFNPSTKYIYRVDEFKGQFLFYDTSELAEVAAGIRQLWEPHPYATMDIDHYLFNVTSHQQKHHVNACCFDRISGVLYVFEYLADGDKPLIHVWEVISDSDSPPKRNKKGGVRR